VLVASFGFTAGAHAEAAAPAPRGVGFAPELLYVDDLMTALDALREPLQSPVAVDRKREGYRRWLVEASEQSPRLRG
jgi:hypothetical protein